MATTSLASLERRIAQMRASNKRALEAAERRSVELEKAAALSNERISNALRALRKAGYRV